MKAWLAVTMGVALAAATGTAAARDRGDRVEHRLDQRGDRIEQRLDRKGDRIEQRYDRRARKDSGPPSANVSDRFRTGLALRARHR